MYLCVQYEQSQNASQFECYRSLGPCRHGHIAMINKQRSLNWISYHTNRFWRQAIAGADWDYKGHMTTVKKYLSSWETTLSVNCRATRYTRLFFALLLLRLRKTIFDSTYNQLQQTQKHLRMQKNDTGKGRQSSSIPRERCTSPSSKSQPDEGPIHQCKNK